MVRRAVRELAGAQRSTAASQARLAAALADLAALHDEAPFLGIGSPLPGVATGLMAMMAASGLSRMGVVFRQLNDLALARAQALENALVFPLEGVKAGEEGVEEAAKAVATKVNLYQARLAKLAKAKTK